MTEWINIATTSAAGCALDCHSFYLQSEDAKRWCNSMFSNNIRKLNPQQGNRSAICDDRGRMQGLIDIYCVKENKYLCILDGVDTNWFQQKFSMFMILDDIEHEPVQTSLLHICGPQSQDVLTKIGYTLPNPNHQYSYTQNAHVLRKSRFGVEGFDIICENIPQQIEELTQAGMTNIPYEALDALRIKNGLAKWPNDGTEKSMIHELALNEECCAFDKGCYIGQEIINRIDVKGILNKKIHKVLIDGEANLGDSLKMNDKTVGNLTSLATFDDKKIGLSVLKKVAWSNDAILTITSGGTARVIVDD